MPAAQKKSTEKTELTNEQKVARARSRAESRILSENRDTFVEYMKEEVEREGAVWNPRKSARERAEEKLKGILAEFPDLAESVESA
jgi:hypothetical protein